MKEIKLKEIANVTMGQSPSGSSYNNKKIGHAFMQGNKTFGYIYPTIDTWTTEPKKYAEKNSVLMSVRAPVGDLNIANENICIGRGLCSIQMKNSNNLFLYYLLKNCIYKLKLSATGTVFESINKDGIDNFKVPDFSEIQQKKIAKILWSIDSKINLNTKINNNLYEILV